MASRLRSTIHASSSAAAGEASGPVTVTVTVSVSPGRSRSRKVPSVTCSRFSCHGTRTRRRASTYW